MSVELTWLGHACWLVKSGEHKLLVDPFLNDNPSAKLRADDLDVDFILITHGHFDHVADAASIARRCNATIIANYEIATWFSEKHQVQQTLGMNIGGATKQAFGRVQMTLAFHSSQLPDGSYGGNPGGFVVETGLKRIYFAGDTALFGDMKLLGNKLLDAAIIPIGDLFTMGPEDSVQATQFLRPRVVLPSHYNTWPPIAQDAQAWAGIIRAQTPSQPLTPAVGEPVRI